MKRQYIRWMSVDEARPDDYQRVLVYNGVHVWQTTWKQGLTRRDVKYPVTHFAVEYGLPYRPITPAADADPQCYVHEKAMADARRARFKVRKGEAQ